ncbi:hypothetical protein [Paenibacillus medicaginis]|uniref:Uncharacterized protein n=1 Tax=Paenibacillus medicaginis TaxID=1470560 RepID=A0ABV5BV64_9BACL
MARKAKCVACGREIDTQKFSHYKFGRDIVCYVEASEDCVVHYAYRHFQERGDGEGRASDSDYE